MELVTIGRDIHPGKTVQLWYDPQYKFSPEYNTHDRFRLILVEEGSGILNLNGRRLLFSAPTVFCISEQEVPLLEQGSDFKARVIFFHPGAVNSRLSFDNIRQGADDLTPTEINDCTCLKPYFLRSIRYFGQLNIGPAAAKRMVQLFDSIHTELTEQRDEFWLCRSRSFFPELLFVVERIYFNPEITEEVSLPDKANDIDQVILYLHTNYKNKITIEELTEAFHINRNTLREKFTEITGMSVMIYLINLRLRVAELMLKDTLVPISEIMDRAGFNDSTHFGRTFRKHYGCSPSEYREQYCWLLK
ncbi:MAG: AraC family transcriptional regulator [Bacillota bacterium]